MKRLKKNRPYLFQKPFTKMPFIRMKKLVASNCFFSLYMLLVGIYLCVFVCVCVYSWYTHICIWYCYIWVFVWVFVYIETDGGQMEEWKDLHLAIVNEWFKNESSFRYVFCYNCQPSHILMKIDSYIYAW